ncbi:MAG: hypothetical protein PHS16_00075 [Candidatus Colwellbacteria bacterium]|mgnify:CR=1 FL=1|jgi:DNA polymerase III delta subunit|nr:hypothetical protein [Candidatus Colwellbacteria bacterium]MDD3752336.1 hypothetical protein [Candidatus Colwellbacteria bacterium]MDD4818597.1 hypothetical protein [Candidatus Colwellbacteria bacterium]
MIIFLYGEDSFRRKRKYSEITSEFIKKNGTLGFSEFDDDDFKGFLECVKNRSIFTPLTLTAVKNIELNSLSKDFFDALKKISSKIASRKDEIMLISSSDENPPSNMNFLTESPAISQEFKQLPKEKFIFFIIKIANEKGIKLSKENAENLSLSLDKDLWAISSELDKMASAKNISLPAKKDIFIGSYFELLNSLKFGKSREKKLIALELLLNKLKEDPARIFNGLAYSAPRNVSSEDWFSLMADYDIAIKSGKMDYEEVLLDFAIR